MKITSSENSLHISLTIPLTMKGEYTYGDGEWIAPAICVFIDENFQEYGLFHTQYLDYKDGNNLQATSMIVAFDSKEEALKTAQEFGLSIQYAHSLYL